MRQMTSAIVLLMMLLGLAGYNSVEKKKEAQLLEDRMRQYGKMIRWAHYEDAFGYLKLAPGEEIEIPENIDNIRVTSYEVYIPPVKLDEKSAVQTVKIVYVFKDRQVLKTMTDKQYWAFDEEAGNWYRTNPIPPFK